MIGQVEKKNTIHTENWTRHFQRIDDCQSGKKKLDNVVFGKIIIGRTTSRWSNAMQNTFGFEIKDIGLCNNMRLLQVMVISWFKGNAWNFVYHVSHTFFGTSVLRKHS